MATLFTNIKLLAGAREEFHLLRGKDLSILPQIENAYLIVEGEYIADYGRMEDLQFDTKEFAFHFDVSGKIILPAWCDSHTHLVFAGSRESEFVDKING